MAQARWEFAVAVVVEGRGEGREFWQGGLRLLLFLSIPTRYDKGVDLCQDLLPGLLKNCW
jgi:hypothetical protein